MKKHLLFTVLALLSIIANAQEEKVRFGAKAGLNIANQLGDEFLFSETKSRTGFHIGLLVEAPVTEKLAFSPELIYSSQGFRLNAVTFDNFFGALNIESTVKLDYINLPIMAKYYIAKGLSLQAGPQIGVLVSAKSEGSAFGIKTGMDIKDFVETIDYAFNFGLGYQLDIGLFFDVRYNRGLGNINDGNGSSVPENQNGVFQLSAGYKF